MFSDTKFPRDTFGVAKQVGGEPSLEQEVADYPRFWDVWAVKVRVRKEDGYAYGEVQGDLMTCQSTHPTHSANFRSE